MGLFKWKCVCCNKSFSNIIDKDGKDVECNIEIALCPECFNTTAGKYIFGSYYDHKSSNYVAKDLAARVILFLKSEELDQHHLEQELYALSKDVLGDMSMCDNNSLTEMIKEYRHLNGISFHAARLFKQKYNKTQEDLLKELKEDVVEYYKFKGWNKDIELLNENL